MMMMMMQLGLADPQVPGPPEPILMAKHKTAPRKASKEGADGSKLLSKYLREYFADRKDLEAFEQHVNEQMAAYEETERKRQDERLSRAGAPDDEGFIMVVSKRPKVFEGEGDEEEKPKEPQKSVPKPPCKVLANFYKHVEGPEKHRAEQLEDLRRKFEEDRRRLEQLKRSRLFNPL